MNLEQNLVLSRIETRQRMSKRNSKYIWWLRAMEHSGLLFGNADMGRMFEVDYLWMREVDDIVDGHLELPHEYATKEQYVMEKRKVLKAVLEPHDRTDGLIALSEDLSKKTGIDLQNERDMILESMLFDARRFGTRQIFPEQELNEYFYRCDIEGTARGTLKMFREDPEAHGYIYPLGAAVRIHYNLRDFEEDIQAGYVNVSEEDCSKFGITPEDLQNHSSESVRAWFQSEAVRGMGYLQQHKDIIGNAGFKPISRFVIHLYHEIPTQKFIKNILAGAQ